MRCPVKNRFDGLHIAIPGNPFGCTLDETVGPFSFIDCRQAQLPFRNDEILVGWNSAQNRDPAKRFDCLLLLVSLARSAHLIENNACNRSARRHHLHAKHHCRDTPVHRAAVNNKQNGSVQQPSQSCRTVRPVERHPVMKSMVPLYER